MNYRLLADDLLVKLLRGSDSLAFEAVYRRHWERVYRLALSKTRHTETAEDITQQVFVSVWERRREAEIDCLQAYLSAAVRYRCISHFESRYSRSVQAGLESAPVQVDASTEQMLDHDDLKRSLERAMELLPPRTREVFELSRIRNRSVREIAQSLDISEKAVEYHVTRSLKVMRNELKDYLYPLFCIMSLLADLLSS